MITPGTTPTFEYDFPTDIQPGVCDIELIMAQDKTIKIHKETSDFSTSGQTASVTLSQNDTRAFCPFIPVEVELWVKLADGTVPEPFRYTESVDTCLGGSI